MVWRYYRVLQIFGSLVIVWCGLLYFLNILCYLFMDFFFSYFSDYYWDIRYYIFSYQYFFYFENILKFEILGKEEY